MITRHQQKACRAAEDLGGAGLRILPVNHRDQRDPPPLLSVEPRPCHMLGAGLFFFLMLLF